MYNKTPQILQFFLFLSLFLKSGMEKTNQQYDAIMDVCRSVFINKMNDYGISWHILRPTSLTDQILIKASRIRNIETTGVTKVNEGIRPEFIGIVNYAIMGLIQLESGPSEQKPEKDVILRFYNSYFQKAKALMQDKNHDYGEAWRKMRISSYTDLILMKLNRTKEIENNQGKTMVSEGIDANYLDMINYAMFALIKIDFDEED